MPWQYTGTCHLDHSLWSQVAKLPSCRERHRATLPKVVVTASDSAISASEASSRGVTGSAELKVKDQENRDILLGIQESTGFSFDKLPQSEESEQSLERRLRLASIDLLAHVDVEGAVVAAEDRRVLANCACEYSDTETTSDDFEDGGNILPSLEDDDSNTLKPSEGIGAYDSKWDDENDVDEAADEVVSDNDEYEPETEDDGYKQITDAFIAAMGGKIRLRVGIVDTYAERNMELSQAANFCDTSKDEYLHLAKATGRPAAETRTATESPLARFFVFFSKAKWVDISSQSNRYREQNLGRQTKDQKVKPK
ncbi:hypothetical protein PybrP1_005931 [[Pythium] brassicae (nom. inval.)]|nr:hypothetical protein PybrP1_005931 [[Pythium] brassicae (nom. inval.)]